MILLPAKKEKTDETNTLEISSQAVQVTLSIITKDHHHQQSHGHPQFRLPQA
jgi:hypothetical protein